MEIAIDHEKAMMDFFAVEPDTVEIECRECGKVFTAIKNHKNHSLYCDECKTIVKNRMSRKGGVTGEPCMNFAFAVVEQAVKDSDKGDRDAKQWLVARDGLQRWLKFCGIDMRPSQILRIRRIV